MKRSLGWLAALFALVALAAALDRAVRGGAEAGGALTVQLDAGTIATMYLAVSVALLGGLTHVFARQAHWDRLAAAAVNIALLLTTGTTAGISIWARPEPEGWNTRFLSAAVPVLIYIAYRGLLWANEDADRRTRVAPAVVIILGAKVSVLDVLMRQPAGDSWPGSGPVAIVLALSLNAIALVVLTAHTLARRALLFHLRRRALDPPGEEAGRWDSPGHVLRRYGAAAALVTSYVRALLRQAGAR